MRDPLHVHRIVGYHFFQLGHTGYISQASILYPSQVEFQPGKEIPPCRIDQVIQMCQNRTGMFKDTPGAIDVVLQEHRSFGIDVHNNAKPYDQ